MRKKKFGLWKVSGIFVIAGILLFSGCSSIELKIIKDGLYQYIDLNDKASYNKEDCYAIVGENEQLPEVLYVPAYYKEKEVRYAWYPYRASPIAYTFRMVGLSLKGVEKVYFPYTYDLSHSGGIPGPEPLSEKIPPISFLTKTEGINFYYWLSNLKNGEVRKVYVTEKAYKAYGGTVNKYKVKEEGGYVKYYDESVHPDFSRQYCLQIANTSYVFNYEEAPNDGYFFINDFERGGKIETTPYEPRRSGYTFAGWHKDAECLHEWDFERDTLPKAEYDEEGILRFVETKLYAKWKKIIV